MKISTIFSEGMIPLPFGVLDKIESMGENELKVLIYICREAGKPLGDFKSESAATALGISKTDVENALSFLRGAELIKTSGKDAPAKKQTSASAKSEEKPKVNIVSNTPPVYSGPEIDRLVREDKAFANLKNESEKIFGKPLRPVDINKLATMYNYLAFDEAYILQLFDTSKDRSNPMDYAYKKAVDYYNRGILTYDALLEDIAKNEEKKSFENKIKKLFGIEQRSLTSREKGFFEIWQKYDFDLVSYAYELTVDSTGKISMPYMNKILTNFAEQGVKTVDEAKQRTEKHKIDKLKQPSQSGFDEEEFFAVALESTYKKNNTPKE